MATRGRSRTRSRSRDRDDLRGEKPANARYADKRVFISNIPYDSRWQDIKDLFRKEVGEVSFVELFSDENDRPRGCGVIEFADSATAKKAIEKMHRFEMSGRKIVVKEDYDLGRDKQGRLGGGGGQGGGGRGGRGGGGDGNWNRGGDGGNWVDGRDEMMNAGPGQKPSFGNTYGLSQTFLENLGIDGPLIPKIFISNLDFRVDDKKLKEVFRLAGRVMFGEVNKDKDGKSRGHGVIEFEHPVEAVQAISMFNNQHLFDRVMHVKLDRLSDPLADLAKNKLPEGLRSIGRGLNQDGSPLTNVASFISSQSSSGGSQANSNAAANTQAMNTLSAMNNLAQLPALQAVLANMGQMGQISGGASQYGTTATVIPGNAIPIGVANVGGMPTGTGMANQSGSGVAGSSSQPPPPPQPQYSNAGNGNQGGNMPMSGGGNGGNYRDMDYGGHYQTIYNQPNQQQNFQQPYPTDQKPKFSNGVGGQGGQNRQTRSNTVIVTNLPASCTWQTLKSKFRECGEVVFAEKRDNNTGVVRFSNDRDAEAAVNTFDQSRVDGRLVAVNFL